MHDTKQEIPVFSTAVKASPRPAAWGAFGRARTHGARVTFVLIYHRGGSDYKLVVCCRSCAPGRVSVEVFRGRELAAVVGNCPESIDLTDLHSVLCTTGDGQLVTGSRGPCGEWL
ncbi:hypothetical protein PAMP_007611 [Pampus punctatissimus]